MKPFIFVSVVALIFVASSAFSGDTPVPAKPVDQMEQIKLLLAKIESLEKRIAALEEENRTLRQDLDRLTAFTEIGVPIDVERAMIGDGMLRSNQSRQFR
jgi:hypothetical protein